MNTQTRTINEGVVVTEEIDWEALYKEYLPRVYNFLRYRVGDESLAEDLTAAVFEKAWRSRKKYRQNLSAFSTWLFTIARNTVTDYFRRNGHDVSLELAPEQADPISLEDTIQYRQDFVRLNFLLSQMPARERELIAFKYGAGLTNREIARLTRLSESNVGTILNRAVEKLRKEMDVNNER